MFKCLFDRLVFNRLVLKKVAVTSLQTWCIFKTVLLKVNCAFKQLVLLNCHDNWTHALPQCAKIVCEYILREKKFFERNLRGDFIVLVRKSSWLFLFFKTHPYLYPNDCCLKVGATMWLNVPQHQHYFLGDRFSWIILRRSKLMVLFHPFKE